MPSEYVKNSEYMTLSDEPLVIDWDQINKIKSFINALEEKLLDRDTARENRIIIKEEIKMLRDGLPNLINKVLESENQ